MNHLHEIFGCPLHAEEQAARSSVGNGLFFDVNGELIFVRRIEGNFAEFLVVETVLGRVSVDDFRVLEPHPCRVKRKNSSFGYF